MPRLSRPTRLWRPVSDGRFRRWRQRFGRLIHDRYQSARDRRGYAESGGLTASPAGGS